MKVLAVVISIVGFFAILGYVGDYDWAEQVILRMSQEQYDSVRQQLKEKNGCEPSEREIAHYWEENHNMK